MKKNLDDVKADPTKYSPSQIEGLLSGFEDNVEKANALDLKYKTLEETIDGRIASLDDLLKKAGLF